MRSLKYYDWASEFLFLMSWINSSKLGPLIDRIGHNYLTEGLEKQKALKYRLLEQYRFYE